MPLIVGFKAGPAFISFRALLSDFSCLQTALKVVIKVEMALS
jgi:hypothetical protein